MKNFFSAVVFVILLGATWSVTVLHRCVLPPPSAKVLTEELEAQRSDVVHPGRWFPHGPNGVNQVFLWGTPYYRGLQEGAFTKDLMFQEENALYKRFKEFFPNRFVRGAFILSAMRWFWGIDRYFESWMLEEMYGVSGSASKNYDSILDSYSRQLAYHGLHEVGQFFVDHGQMDFGCTVFAVPTAQSWVIGRNFDFEGGRIFDAEKIVKWVFPDKGQPFVSVIWAGMVGAVTGVNRSGVYLSINAAGSSDYRRYGTPSTLVVLKALEFSDSAEAAVKILTEAQTFITDIFIVADKKHAYRVEKSPKTTRVVPITGPSVITNHLQDPVWDHDKVNNYRKQELTTLARYSRGQTLLNNLPSEIFPSEAVARVLGFLRDKYFDGKSTLQLGNRASIDALIASHAVIYDAARGILYVSTGPSLVGEFVGFDLATSFRESGPGAEVPRLPADPQVTAKSYHDVKAAADFLVQAQALIEHHQCERAGALVREAESLYSNNSIYHSIRGNYLECHGDHPAALAAWKAALALEPAYPQERRALEARLEKEKK